MHFTHLEVYIFIVVVYVFLAVTGNKKPLSGVVSSLHHNGSSENVVNYS